jgi:hypothetical protein
VNAGLRFGGLAAVLTKLYVMLFIHGSWPDYGADAVIESSNQQVIAITDVTMRRQQMIGLASVILCVFCCVHSFLFTRCRRVLNCFPVADYSLGTQIYRKKEQRAEGERSVS